MKPGIHSLRKVILCDQVAVISHHKPPKKMLVLAGASSPQPSHYSTKQNRTDNAQCMYAPLPQPQCMFVVIYVKCKSIFYVCSSCGYAEEMR